MPNEEKLQDFYTKKSGELKSKEIYKLKKTNAKNDFEKKLKNKNVLSRLLSREKIDLTKNMIDRFYELKDDFDKYDDQLNENLLKNVDSYFDYFNSSENNNKKSANNLIEQDTIQTITKLQNYKRQILEDIGNLVGKAKKKSDKENLLKYQKQLMALKFAKTNIKKQAAAKQLYSYTTAKNAIFNETKNSGIMGELLKISDVLDPLFSSSNFSKSLSNIKTKDLKSIAKIKSNKDHSIDESFRKLKDISDHWNKISALQPSDQNSTNNTINDIKNCKESIQAAYKDFYKVIENSQSQTPIKLLQSLKNKISPKKIPTNALNRDLDKAYQELRDKIPKDEVSDAMLNEWFKMKCLSLSFVELVTRFNALKSITNTGYIALFAILSTFSFTCAVANALALNIVITIIFTLILAWCLKHIDKNYKSIPKDPKKFQVDIENENLKNATRGPLS